MSLPDNPIVFSGTDVDLLDRLPAVAALRKLLENPTLATPIVVGVYGSWGIGKTSLMKTLEAQLASPERMMLWFDAWIYGRQEEALWRALLLRVVEALRAKLGELPEFTDKQDRESAEKALDEARASLYRSMTLKEQGGIKVNWGSAVPFAADAALAAMTSGLTTQIAKALSGGDDTGGLVGALTSWFKGRDTKEAMKIIEREASERYVEQVVSLEQFQQIFKDLLARFKIGTTRRLFIFIDDLDRCLPEDAVAALEAVKLFLDFTGCVFVLGMDRSVIEQGIRVRYRELGTATAFDPRQYLDKIIQLPFTLPPLGQGQISHYLQSLSQLVGHEGASASQDLIHAAAPANPRALKRVLNILQLTLYLASTMDGDSNFHVQDLDRMRYIAKIVLMQVVFDEAYRALTLDPARIKEVENFAERRATKLTDDEKEKIYASSALQALLKRTPPFSSLQDYQIEELFTLSRVTSSG
ncbi:MAG TPA: P-loop NTPase fold protein [Candidatus Elarobacter sp.]|jgi:hypothetical protein